MSKCPLCGQKARWKKNRKYENWYWGICLPLIAKHTGEDNLKRLHATFKSLFLKQMVELKDQVYEAVGSTQNMSSEQHGECVEKIVRFAAEELGVAIPEPDPLWQFKE